MQRLDPDATDEFSCILRAVALHRLPDQPCAQAEVARLVEMRPEDPFHRELQGQLLLESGRAEEAVETYRAAVARAPEEPLIRAALGRALLALDRPETETEAAKTLERARAGTRMPAP
jgi:Putative Zn-dependent protease, contains TPR repeats